MHNFAFQQKHIKRHMYVFCAQTDKNKIRSQEQEQKEQKEREQIIWVVIIIHKPFKIFLKINQRPQRRETSSRNEMGLSRNAILWVGISLNGPLNK